MAWERSRAASAYRIIYLLASFQTSRPITDRRVVQAWFPLDIRGSLGSRRVPPRKETAVSSEEERRPSQTVARNRPWLSCCWWRCGWLRSEHASNVFHSFYTRGIQKRDDHRSFWTFAFGKVGDENHLIVVTTSSFKSAVLKVFSVHLACEQQTYFTRRTSSLKSVLKGSVFVTD